MSSLLLHAFFAAAFLTLPGSGQVPSPATPPAVRHAATDTLKVTVNGTDIRESDVERRFLAMVRQRTGGAPIDESQLAQVRPQWHPMVLEQMIEEVLFEEDAKNAGLTVSEEEYAKFYQQSFDAQLFRQNMALRDFEKIIEMREDITIDEFLARESAQEEYRASVRQVRLIVKRYPDETKITGDDIQARYERERDKAFTQGAEVTASHILIGFDGAQTDEEKAVKRAEAERVLKLCLAEGADFAELAKEHSTGPSGPAGGQLGSFPRTGKMVEPFAKAAFELKVGEISDVVETQFGYHLIHVTARKEGRVVPVEEARPILETEMLMEKVTPLRTSHATKLREGAEIVYPSNPAK